MFPRLLYPTVESSEVDMSFSWLDVFPSHVRKYYVDV